MASRNVLIVDDDLGDRKMICRMLAERCPDDRLFEASSCEEALHFDGCVPDAVILDHMLPGQTGLEMLDQVRQLWPGAACFLMTGQGDEQIAKSAIKLGASDYATKRSLTPGALQRMLDNGIEFARLSQKIASQQEELQTFANMLVHDFKTPVRGVLHLSQMVAEDLAGGDMEGARSGLDLLVRSAQQMSDLVDSLAIHIRLDREETCEEAPLREVTDRALTALAPDIAKSGARVDVLTPDQPLWCAPPQIAQLLQNLFSNAIKFSGEAVPVIRVSAAPCTDGMILVEVADNGIGIPPGQRDRIFEPFQRLAGREQVPGTGLGLATCRRIIERHDGRIWCEAHPAGGTAFRFTLPSQAGAASQLAAPGDAAIH